jgi:Cu(I)/Ag(I) efflux system membrane protein CusA/SilA
MPIKARIDMLSTGIRTPVGVKIYGADLAQIEKLGREIEKALRALPDTASAYAERVLGGYYLEIVPDREKLARRGLSVAQLQETVAMALGGETVTTMIEGRERYAVNLRLARELRDGPAAIRANVRIAAADGAFVPISEVAEIRLTSGPASIRTENARLAAYVFVDTRASDIAGYVAAARAAVAAGVTFPPGYYVEWSGQFEYIERARQRLAIVVPATLMIVFLLLYANFGRLAETAIVMLSLPFSLVGGLWLMWWLGFNFSVAVAVGFIALAGVAAETGVVMLIYLENALAERRRRAAAEGRPSSLADLHAAVMEGAVDRVRPKMMTVSAIVAGLLPILWSSGTGSEIMQRIAVPMVGGMASSMILTLIVIPAIFSLLGQWRMRHAAA